MTHDVTDSARGLRKGKGRGRCNTTGRLNKPQGTSVFQTTTLQHKRGDIGNMCLTGRRCSTSCQVWCVASLQERRQEMEA